MTRAKIEQIEFDNKLKPYFEINLINGKKFYVCKKCQSQIKAIHMKHYNSCTGIGTRRDSLFSIPEKNKHLYSELCDMGCGQKSAFYYKNGKAYCCELGAKCSVKVAKDKLKKDGINPWEGKPHPRGKLGKKSWNSGLTKENNEKLQISSEKISKSLKLNHKHHPCTHTQETKDKLSQIAFAGKYGGYQPGSGYGKKGWYKGYFCDSSWELAYVIYCLEHQIPIERNKVHRKYMMNGKEKKYYPDFIIHKNSSSEQIIEIKGYHSLEADAKSFANPDVVFLYEEHLGEVFDYVKNKYGKNYTDLYEKE